MFEHGLGADHIDSLFMQGCMISLPCSHPGDYVADGAVAAIHLSEILERPANSCDSLRVQTVDDMFFGQHVVRESVVVEIGFDERKLSLPWNICPRPDQFHQLIEYCQVLLIGRMFHDIEREILFGTGQQCCKTNAERVARAQFGNATRRVPHASFTRFDDVAQPDRVAITGRVRATSSAGKFFADEG